MKITGTRLIIILMLFAALLSGCSKQAPPTRLATVEDMADKRIGVCSGFIYDKFATERFPAATVLRYNAQSEAIGKLLVILHVPFIALALALVAWRSRRYYAEHFVVALGMTTFALLFVQLLLKPAEWLYTRVHGWLGTSGGMPAVVPLLLLAIFVGHFAAACRRCYDGGWWRALVQGIAAFVAFAAASMWVYRPAQFLLALWTM